MRGESDVSQRTPGSQNGGWGGVGEGAGFHFSLSLEEISPVIYYMIFVFT